VAFDSQQHRFAYIDQYIMAIYSLTREVNTENCVCRMTFTIYKLPCTKARDYCSNILVFHFALSAVGDG